jgi:Xaa-Pro aminopeptidase
VAGAGRQGGQYFKIKISISKFYMFDTSTYTKRRKILKQNVDSGIILLLGNEESGINYADNHFHFRQDSSYLYYVGLNQPHQAVILDTDEGKEILFADDPDISQIIWTGPVPSREDLARKAGIEHHRPYQDLKSYLLEYKKGRTVHFLPPYRSEHTLKLQQWLGLNPGEIEANKSIKLIKAIVEQRSVKTEAEIEQIEEAVNVTGKMHLEAIRAARPGMKEYEVVSRVHQKVLEQGCELSFPVILTVDGQTLHNHYHGNEIREKDVILCDAGAENAMGYAGDISRTFPAGKKFTGLQRSLYEVVLQSQLAAVDALEPGIPFKDVHLTACKVLVEGLKELDLMKGSVDDAIQEGAHTLFFQCGLGHMMGLDVHDMENLGEEFVGYTDDLQQSTEFGLKSLRLGRELEPGFVVTIEPGIYLIPELIQYRKEQGRYTDFVNYEKVEKIQDAGGYRVEDDYLITEDGARLLGDPIPKTIDEIEDLRSRALNPINVTTQYD